VDDWTQGSINREQHSNVFYNEAKRTNGGAKSNMRLRGMQVLLKAGAAGADEIAQRAYVRAVSADATRIDRQAEHLGLLDA
jgi:hypothetical protein